MVPDTVYIHCVCRHVVVIQWVYHRNYPFVMCNVLNGDAVKVTHISRSVELIQYK